MNGHPRIIAYLQRAVNHEFTAAQQYTLQAVQAEALGLQQIADELRQGVREELGHAEDFLRRLIAIDVMPRAGQLNQPQVGRTYSELLRYGLRTEADAIRLYTEARQYCKQVGDSENHAVFDRILADEVKHHQYLERQLAGLGGGV